VAAASQTDTRAALERAAALLAADPGAAEREARAVLAAAPGDPRPALTPGDIRWAPASRRSSSISPAARPSPTISAISAVTTATTSR